MNEKLSNPRRTLPAVLVFFAWLALPSGAPGQTPYQNPVVPGDYPDPSVIRVGKDYWATATSSEWGPQFPVLHSTDLVNWELTGTVFAHRPAWAVANFWAPEISEYKGRYYVYYVGRRKGGPLAVSVATAEQPQGPYADHSPLVSQPAGSIDPVPVVDEKGQRYLIWKEDGNSRKLPTILWAQPLSEDGLKLTGEPKEILRNDAGWEGAVVEGPFVVRHQDWFYLFYSGNGCCGRGCGYALGVARSKTLLGPWEKNPANPILAGNERWKCPGHGSIVMDERGRYWLMYHAYSAKDFVFTGREALLDEVKFAPDGWPEINGGKGPSIVAASPFGVAQNPASAAVNFIDDFNQPELKLGWQWPQESEPSWSLDAKGSGGLTLAPQAGTNVMGAMLARSTTSGNYEATVILRDTSPGATAGIAAIGDHGNAAGLAMREGKLTLWRRDKGKHQVLEKVPAPTKKSVHLRVVGSEWHDFAFAFSVDGKNWSPVGKAQRGDDFPPWDRSIRVGLTTGGVSGAKATFEQFRLKSQPGKNN